eukprot:2741336-Prymnesium_polylepis.2
MRDIPIDARYTVQGARRNWAWDLDWTATSSPPGVGEGKSQAADKRCLKSKQNVSTLMQPSTELQAKKRHTPIHH